MTGSTRGSLFAAVPPCDNALMDSFDQAMMCRALELAERGRGYVEPNPLVGAVVLRDDRIVGEGWHQRYGEAHAEVNALAAAGEAARGATLYVSLEPCCHHGKTPPCSDAILRAGIRRVVAGMLDPFSEMAGKSVERLRAAGIEVQVGVGEAEARLQNAPYLKLLRTGLPYVIAKWAMSLDGKIATRTGESRWITGEAARRRVHQLRGRMDAIIAGIGTVLADDPLLTARPPGPRVPMRVILDSRLQLPPDSQIVRTARETPVLVAHRADASAEARDTLTKAGCECLAIVTSDGRPAVPALLEELGRRRFTNVLVEGGAAVLGSFFDARCVDEIYVFVAPKIIGGRGATSPICGAGIEHLAEALGLDTCSVERICDDWLFRGRMSQVTHESRVVS